MMVYLLHMFIHNIKKSGVFCIPFLLFLSSATENGTVTTPVAQLYQQAEMAYGKQDYQTAIALYQRIRQDHFQTPYAEKAHLNIIQAHIDARQFEQAKKELTTFKEIYPETKYFTYVTEVQKYLNTGWVTWSNMGKILVGIFALEMTRQFWGEVFADFLTKIFA